MECPDSLLKIILKNQNISAVLDIAEKVNLPNWYLSGGSIAQTIWNSICGLPIDYGISDYDLIYFDFEHEKLEAKELELRSSLNGIPIEMVNQAFVHTWLPKYLKKEMKPYTSTEDVLNRTSATVISLGLKRENGKYIIYAPFGTNDIFDMIIRPVKELFTKEMHDTKVEKWKAKWPTLKIIEWE